MAQFGLNSQTGEVFQVHEPDLAEVQAGPAYGKRSGPGINDNSPTACGPQRRMIVSPPHRPKRST